MFDGFVKADGIEGESTDADHVGWIEVLLCDVGVTQKVSSTASSASGASTERANFQDFNFTKQLDKASPKLALACANGTHIDRIVVELYRAGGDKVKFMEYILHNCIISKVETAAGGDFPFEHVSINWKNRVALYPAKTSRRRRSRQSGSRLEHREKLQNVTTFDESATIPEINRHIPPKALLAVCG